MPYLNVINSFDEKLGGLIILLITRGENFKNMFKYVSAILFDDLLKRQHIIFKIKCKKLLVKHIIVQSKNYIEVLKIQQSHVKDVQYVFL